MSNLLILELIKSEGFSLLYTTLHNNKRGKAWSEKLKHFLIQSLLFQR